jgi:hypothetical protein
VKTRNRENAPGVEKNTHLLMMISVHVVQVVIGSNVENVVNTLIRSQLYLEKIKKKIEDENIQFSLPIYF